jgi:hypothetical protein
MGLYYITVISGTHDARDMHEGVKTLPAKKCYQKLDSILHYT